MQVWRQPRPRAQGPSQTSVCAFSPPGSGEGTLARARAGAGAGRDKDDYDVEDEDDEDNENKKINSGSIKKRTKTSEVMAGATMTSVRVAQ